MQIRVSAHSQHVKGLRTRLHGEGNAHESSFLRWSFMVGTGFVVEPEGTRLEEEEELCQTKSARPNTDT